MSGLEIIDSHLHWWDRDNIRYSWMDDKDLLQCFGPEEFLQHTEGVAVQGVILVEAAADLITGKKNFRKSPDLILDRPGIERSTVVF